MPDTGVLQHDDDREGGVLQLTGLDGETRRVFAGPRRRQLGSGITAVYAEGTEVGSLFGRSGDGEPDGGALQLSAVPEGADSAEQTALLDGGTRTVPRGSLTLSHATNPDSLAFLGFDSHVGPVLVLSDLDPHDAMGSMLVLSTRGIFVTPSKENFDLSFVAPLPERPGLAAHYCVVEGPEVGVQIRGTATLHDGKATVRLPEHFALVAAPTALTVQLTPRSPRSKGVAASSLSRTELVIEELAGGQGSYDVDWLVQGIRKGREHYEVIRPLAGIEVPRPGRRTEQESE